MSFWDKVRKDMDKGFRDFEKGVKEGFTVIRQKAEMLTAEGKKRYQIFDLKSKAHKYMADLGGIVYAMKDKDVNPLADRRVKTLTVKIAKLETQIGKLESKPGKKTARKKTTRKKTARKKTTRRKTAASS
jgi:hypothetical protein